MHLQHGLPARSTTTLAQPHWAQQRPTTAVLRSFQEALGPLEAAQGTHCEAGRASGRARGGVWQCQGHAGSTTLEHKARTPHICTTARQREVAFTLSVVAPAPLSHDASLTCANTRRCRERLRHSTSPRTPLTLHGSTPKHTCTLMHTPHRMCKVALFRPLSIPPLLTTPHPRPTPSTPSKLTHSLTQGIDQHIACVCKWEGSRIEGGWWHPSYLTRSHSSYHPKHKLGECLRTLHTHTQLLVTQLLLLLLFLLAPPFAPTLAWARRAC